MGDGLFAGDGVWCGREWRDNKHELARALGPACLGTVVDCQGGGGEHTMRELLTRMSDWATELNCVFASVVWRSNESVEVERGSVKKTGRQNE